MSTVVLTRARPLPQCIVCSKRSLRRRSHDFHGDARSARGKQCGGSPAFPLVARPEEYGRAGLGLGGQPKTWGAWLHSTHSAPLIGKGRLDVAHRGPTRGHLHGQPLELFGAIAVAIAAPTGFLRLAVAPSPCAASASRASATIRRADIRAEFVAFGVRPRYSCSSFPQVTTLPCQPSSSRGSAVLYIIRSSHQSPEANK